MYLTKALTILFMLTMVACDKEKNEDADTSDIEGKWTCVRTESYENDNGQVYEWDEDYDKDESYYYYFESGGYFEEGATFTPNDGRIITGTWEHLDDKVILVHGDGSQYEFAIISLTTSKLVLQKSIKYEGYDYYLKHTFIRID